VDARLSFARALGARFALGVLGAHGALGCSSEAELPPTACSGVPVTFLVRTNAGNAFIPAPDVLASCGPCGGTTDLRGEATVPVRANVPFAPRFSRAGLSTTLWPELSVSVPTRLEVDVLRDTLGQRYGLTARAPLVWVKVYPGSTCRSVEGVELSVEGHPEARPVYVGVDGPLDPSLGATSLAGTAVIAGLAGGERIRVLARKPACELDGGPWGALPLESGAVSAWPVFAR
jgi:hypothetical protein